MHDNNLIVLYDQNEQTRSFMSAIEAARKAIKRNEAGSFGEDEEFDTDEEEEGWKTTWTKKYKVPTSIKRPVAALFEDTELAAFLYQVSSDWLGESKVGGMTNRRNPEALTSEVKKFFESQFNEERKSVENRDKCEQLQQLSDAIKEELYCRLERKFNKDKREPTRETRREGAPSPTGESEEPEVLERSIVPGRGSSAHGQKRKRVISTAGEMTRPSIRKPQRQVPKPIQTQYEASNDRSSQRSLGKVARVHRVEQRPKHQLELL
jgi:hypothetical protein